MIHQSADFVPKGDVRGGDAGEGLGHDLGLRRAAPVQPLERDE